MPGERLTLHGELFGQRFRSLAVPAAVEPGFSAEAFIELPEDPLPSPSAGDPRKQNASAVGSGMQEALRLLAIRQPLRLCVTRHMADGGRQSGNNAVDVQLLDM